MEHTEAIFAKASAVIDRTRRLLCGPGGAFAVPDALLDTERFIADEAYGVEAAEMVRQMLNDYCQVRKLGWTDLAILDLDRSLGILQFLDEELQIAYVKATQDPGADRSDPDTLSFLAGLYDSGQTFPLDKGRACELYRLAARGGSSMGQFNLGIMLLNGESVQQNETQAAACFLAAAEQENAQAQAALGVLFLTGRGVCQSDADAALWLKRAAGHGMPDAQLKLGVLLATGRGVKRDLRSALMWTELAGRGGIPEAPANGAAMARQMEQVDVRGALLAVANWHPEPWSPSRRGRYRPMYGI